MQDSEFASAFRSDSAKAAPTQKVPVGLYIVVGVFVVLFIGLFVLALMYSDDGEDRGPIVQRHPQVILDSILPDSSTAIVPE